MGYSNTGEEGWFKDIDLAALQSIWGNSNASKNQFEVYKTDIGDEIYAQVTFIDGGGNLETIVSDTMAIIAWHEFTPYLFNLKFMTKKNIPPF